MLMLRFTGWFGGVLFLIAVCFELWLYSTDDGLEFNEQNAFLLRLPSIAFVVYFVVRCLWIATQGFTSNPLNNAHY
jgi:hypothetical protein